MRCAEALARSVVSRLTEFYLERHLTLNRTPGAHKFLGEQSTRLRAQLTREGKLTHEQFDKIDKQAKETVLASVKFAEKSPEPPLEKLYDYTYADGAKP